MIMVKSRDAELGADLCWWRRWSKGEHGGTGRGYDRFVRWRRDGTWDRLLAHAQTKADAVGQVIWEVSVDSTVARAHQHAAGARRWPSRADQKRGCGIRPTRRSDAAAAD